MPLDELDQEFDLDVEELPIALPATCSAGQERSTPFSFQGCWTVSTIC
jgi:hypothetical protein